MALQVGEMSRCEVRWSYRSYISQVGEMSQGEVRCNIIQVGKTISGEVRWPYR